MSQFLSRHAMIVSCFLLGGFAFTLTGCKSPEKQLRLELINSFNNYTKSLKSRREDDLRKTLFIPDTKNYKSHVDNLLLAYLEDIKQGKVNFDPQGIILTRLLGLNEMRWNVIAVKQSEDQSQATLRLSVTFSYDANIEYSRFENGTRIFIPGKPISKVHEIVIGGDNEIPRMQLDYIELVATFKATNLEGQWQLRTLEADQTAARWVESYKGH